MRRISSGGCPPARVHARQRFPVDPLHRDEEHAVLVAQVVDREDVRVVEPGGRAGLVNEAFPSVAVGGESVGQHLDRDPAPERRVLGEVHLSHSAGTDGFENLVAAERLSDHGRDTSICFASSEVRPGRGFARYSCPRRGSWN